MRRAALRVLIYALPLLLWLGIAALLSTELGSYQQSWILLHKLFDWIEPGFYYPDPQIASMYQITQMVRKIAHVVVYGVLTLLVIRLCQQGRAKLRPLSLLMALLIPSAFSGVEVYLRLNQSEGTRHVRLEQFLLNGVGVGLVLITTLAFFGIKSLERWLAQEPLKPEIPAEDISQVDS
jgi:VanZ family protein